MTARRVIGGMLLLLFFASTLVLSWPFARELFVSPDENAAYVFAQTFSDTGRLAIPESLNDDLGGLLHPRSMMGFGQAIVPASFLGFILLLGTVGAVFGYGAMFVVTPVMAVITIIAWRDVVRRIFANELLADAAAFLLMIHPAFWYYSGRVMMHNVAFLAVLVIGFWWLLAQPLARFVNRPRQAVARLFDFMIAGLWFGSALVIRTSEVIWLTAVLALAFILYRHLIGWRATVTFGVGFAVMLAVLGLMNTAVYGSPFANGYTAKYPYAPLEVPTVSTAPAIEEPERNLFLPFGFHERVILKNVIDYGWRLYPWMSVLAVIGLLLVFVDRSERDREWKMLAVLTLGLAAWLGVVYGSWKIIDNPDPSIISLGNSHVRYWLPLFALASIFSTRTLVFMLRDQSKFAQVFTAGIITLMTLLSFDLVFFGHDGFVPSREALATFAAKEERILELTESEAIIVVDRADKYLFPERRVVVPLRSETTYAALPAMLEQAPVYYFGITLPSKDLEYLNDEKLKPLDVRIEWIETMSEESLYRLIAE